jgi:hypothetical protein
MQRFWKRYGVQHFRPAQIIIASISTADPVNMSHPPSPYGLISCAKYFLLHGSTFKYLDALQSRVPKRLCKLCRFAALLSPFAYFVCSLLHHARWQPLTVDLLPTYWRSSAIGITRQHVAVFLSSGLVDRSPSLMAFALKAFSFAPGPTSGNSDHESVIFHVDFLQSFR